MDLFLSYNFSFGNYYDFGNNNNWNKDNPKISIIISFLKTA